MQEINLKDYENYLSSNTRLLFFKAQNLIEKYALRPLGLSFVTLQILFVLSVKKKVYQGTLLEYIPTTPANISNRVERLHKLGLVKTVKTQDDDRRKNYLNITKEGRILLKRGIKEVIKVKNLFVKDFAKKELEIYMDTIEKFSRNVDEAERVLKKNCFKVHHRKRNKN